MAHLVGLKVHPDAVGSGSGSESSWVELGGGAKPPGQKKPIAVPSHQGGGGVPQNLGQKRVTALPAQTDDGLSDFSLLSAEGGSFTDEEVDIEGIDGGGGARKKADAGERLADAQGSRSSGGGSSEKESSETRSVVVEEIPEAVGLVENYVPFCGPAKKQYRQTSVPPIVPKDEAVQLRQWALAISECSLAVFALCYGMRLAIRVSRSMPAIAFGLFVPQMILWSMGVCDGLQRVTKAILYTVCPKNTYQLFLERFGNTAIDSLKEYALNEGMLNQEQIDFVSSVLPSSSKSRKRGVKRLGKESAAWIDPLSVRDTFNQGLARIAFTMHSKTSAERTEHHVTRRAVEYQRRILLSEMCLKGMSPDRLQCLEELGKDGDLGQVFLAVKGQIKGKKSDESLTSMKDSEVLDALGGDKIIQTLTALLQQEVEVG